MGAEGEPHLQWQNKEAIIIADPQGGYQAVSPQEMPPAQRLRTREQARAWRPRTSATPNIVICGDALDATQGLAHLIPPLPAPQLIYIDPPYNTGGKFQHYNDALEHAGWLGMMRTRLCALYDVLAPTGSLWVHLDDSEMHYARVLLDEICGRENFIAQIVVEINPKGRQLDRYFAACHDYLLVYAKDRSQLLLEPGITSSVNPDDFPLEDEEGRYRLLPLRNTNKRFTPETSPTLSYPLYANPDTGEVSVEPRNGCAEEILPVFGDLQPAVWRWSKSTAAIRCSELLARTVRGRKGLRTDIYQIDRMHADRRKKLKTLWPANEVGSSDSAKRVLRREFGDDCQFATPKPEPLLERIIAAATQPGDYVLDVFAGSGTTGVVAARMGRRFILAERQRDTVDHYIARRLAHAKVRYSSLIALPRG